MRYTALASTMAVRDARQARILGRVSIVMSIIGIVLSVAALVAFVMLPRPTAGIIPAVGL